MIRQYPVTLGGGSGLSPYIGLDPSDFSLDSTDIGSGFGSGFGGIVSTVDFAPAVQGTAWAHFNFTSSGFDESKDVLFDLHWIANGVIGSTLAARITIAVWVVDADNSPSASSPTDVVTTNISILTTDTGEKKMTADFITISNADIPSNCESVFARITREAINGADTYTGTFQVINLIARQ